MGQRHPREAVPDQSCVVYIEWRPPNAAAIELGPAHSGANALDD
jgi:hypothetical protein